MIEWKRVPWPLWLFSAALLVEAILLEVGVHGPVLPRIIFPFVMFAWLFFLLRGVRWVWIATVGASTLGLVSDLVLGSLDLLGAVWSLLGLLFLLLPITRRYVFSRGAAVGGET